MRGRGRMGAGPAISSIVAGSYPSERTEDTSGPTVDFGAGVSGYAIQMVGSVVSGTTLTGKLEQSANGIAWSDLPGATFAPVAGSDVAEKIAFVTTLRYVRWNSSITGVGASAMVSVVFAR